MPDTLTNFMRMLVYGTYPVAEWFVPTKQELENNMNKDIGKKIEEFNALAAKQCEEYKTNLEWAILAWYNANPKLVQEITKTLYVGIPLDIERLVRESRQVKFVLGKVDPSIKENDKITVSVVYEYPDYLHSFLC